MRTMDENLQRNRVGVALSSVCFVVVSELTGCWENREPSGSFVQALGCSWSPAAEQTNCLPASLRFLSAPPLKDSFSSWRTTTRKRVWRCLLSFLKLGLKQSSSSVDFCRSVCFVSSFGIKFKETLCVS